MTVAPRCFAIWAAAVPTPLPTAWISTRSPGREPAAGDQRVVGRQEDFGNRRRLGEAQPVGNRERLVGVHRHQLGLRPASHQSHHPVAQLPPSHVAHRLHFAGVLQAGDVGRPPGWRRIVAQALEEIDPVEPRGAHAHSDVAGLHLGLRHLADRDDFGTAGPAQYYGSHRRNLALMES